MKSYYLIDGYNLGFKIPEVAKLIRSGQTDLAVRDIIRRVRKFISTKNARAKIVFDGTHGTADLPSVQGNVDIAFSKKPSTADDVIRKWIRSGQSVANWIVVSSDNEIRFTAQDHGARALRSEEFISQLKSSPTNQQAENYQKYNPGNIDLDYWLKKFKSDDNDT